MRKRAHANPEILREKIIEPERVMTLFVAAKAPVGVQGKAPAPQNPGWLQGVGNTAMRAHRGFPSGLAPQPRADRVATLDKASSLDGTWRLASPRLWGQRGDE